MYHKNIKKLVSRIYRQISVLSVKENKRAEAILYTNKSLKADFKISNAIVLIPLAYSPIPKHTYNLLKRFTSKTND
jgi:hypothetical protein